MCIRKLIGRLLSWDEFEVSTAGGGRQDLADRFGCGLVGILVLVVRREECDVHTCKAHGAHVYGHRGAIWTAFPKSDEPGDRVELQIDCQTIEIAVYVEMSQQATSL